MSADLFEQLTDQRLVTSLRSTFCPACCGVKIPRQTFCRTCYYALPGSMRKNLYNHLGQGYDIAVNDAMIQLGRHQFRLAGERELPPPTSEQLHKGDQP